MYKNTTTLLGFISQEPKVNEKSVRFSIYTKESYKTKEGEWKDNIVYTPVVALGTFVSTASKLKKGDYVLVEGKTIQSSYENKEGKKVYDTSVQVSKLSIIPLKEKETTTTKKGAVEEDFDLDSIPF